MFTSSVRACRAFFSFPDQERALPIASHTVVGRSSGTLLLQPSVRYMYMLMSIRRLVVRKQVPHHGQNARQIPQHGVPQERVDKRDVSVAEDHHHREVQRAQQARRNVGCKGQVLPFLTERRQLTCSVCWGIKSLARIFKVR